MADNKETTKENSPGKRKFNGNSPTERAANPVLNTPDAELPNATEDPAARKKSKEEAEAAFDSSSQASTYNDGIRESQGDMADRAELEIENEIQGEINRIRQNNRENQRH